MCFRVNQPVITPIGEGVYQGRMVPVNPQSVEWSDLLALVRVNLTPESVPHLRDRNCLTPMACSSGLWMFREGELK